MKNRHCQTIMFCLLFLSLQLFACSKNDNVVPPATPTDLQFSAQAVGVSDTTPYGDGSGRVTLNLSGKNVTNYVVAYENTMQSVAQAIGSVTCTFFSKPGTVSDYPIKITSYCNTVKVDTTITVTVYTKGATEPGTGLVWSDEFNGTSLDLTIWNYEKGNNNGWGNNELEYYTGDAANVSVKDGYLQISALHSPNYNNTGFNYTSARITTQNKYSFTFGKVEMRAKLPGDQGTWPALWMLGNTINTIGWPKCGEIDIMEMGTVTGLDNILCSLHWGGDVSHSRKVSGSTTDFHLYSLDWRADHIAFYIDDQLLYSQPNNSSLPFNANFFFIFNVAVGGNMGGNTINLASSNTMYVDYVRVYK